MEEKDKQSRFEVTILPHLDAAYNLARWLTRNDHDAQDVVQDAFLRAFKFFGGFRGGNGRSWLLSIVRNTCYNWLEKNRRKELGTVFDEEIHLLEDTAATPEMRLSQNLDRELVRQVVAELPVEFREIIILRELEEMSYKEIAEIADIPIGTVMSRLARARKLLQESLTQRLAGGTK
ncbi:MAG: polymerase subunit sigma [Pedosphaera sp.]|nr:polymerase subunit sigma [Pedosphaera sp.]